MKIVPKAWWAQFNAILFKRPVHSIHFLLSNCFRWVNISYESMNEPTRTAVKRIKTPKREQVNWNDGEHPLSSISICIGYLCKFCKDQYRFAHWQNIFVFFFWWNHSIVLAPMVLYQKQQWLTNRRYVCILTWS